MTEPPNPVLWRTAAIDGFPITNDEAYGAPLTVGLPNAVMREASSVSDLGLWYAIGEAWSQIAAQFMPNDAPLVLDIGCSCGKMARFFVMNPRLRYIGLDVFRPPLIWCEREFAHLSGRFAFMHLDVHSALYNSNGKQRADAVTLPIDSESVDMVICGSLFTHLLEPAFKRYLSEIRRCLTFPGRALISIHNEPKAGEFSGDETRIDISDTYFTQLACDEGLTIFDDVGVVYGQQLYVLKRA